LAHSTNWLLLPRRLVFSFWNPLSPQITAQKDRLLPRLYRMSKRTGVYPFKWVITSELNQFRYLGPHRTAQPSPVVCLRGNIDSYIYTLRREGDSFCACLLLDNCHWSSEISNLRRWMY
jgi:hypothetical protein